MWFTNCMRPFVAISREGTIPYVAVTRRFYGRTISSLASFPSTGRYPSADPIDSTVREIGPSPQRGQRLLEGRTRGGAPSIPHRHACYARLRCGSDNSQGETNGKQHPFADPTEPAGGLHGSVSPLLRSMHFPYVVDPFCAVLHWVDIFRHGLLRAQRAGNDKSQASTSFSSVLRRRPLLAFIGTRRGTRTSPTDRLW